MFRTMVALSLGLAAGIFGFALGLGATDSAWAALAIALLTGGVAGGLTHRRLPLDPAACSRALVLVSIASTILALVVIGRLSVFMADSSRVAFSEVPASSWELQHSCLSAYYVAGRAVSATPNIYDEALYSLPGAPNAPRVPRKMGLFNVDVYEYPPPFLLLPRAMGLLTADFERTRALWFGLTGLIMLLAMVLVAAAMGPAAGTRALLLTPLVWLSLPVISTLQKGNVQAIVIAGSILAMLLFEKRRWAAGGAVLAFLTLSKLYPGLLVVYLLAQGRWRAIFWTGAMSVVILGASLVDIGWGPYAAFLDHLPGLLGGEAFPAFRRAASMAINFSVPGLVFKLKLFGVPGMSFAASKLVGWMYTLVAVALVVWAARRNWREAERPAIWMAVLILATLRSPFLPQTYAALPPLWLLALLGAQLPMSGKRLAVVLAGWAILNIYWPTDWPMDPRVLALLSGVPQMLTIGLAVMALRFREHVLATEGYAIPSPA